MFGERERERDERSEKAKKRMYSRRVQNNVWVGMVKERKKAFLADAVLLFCSILCV